MTSPGLKEMMDLSGKVALVSGGAGYLGSEISAGLAEFGASVIVASRNGNNCDAFCRQLNEKYGGTHFGRSMDIRDKASIEETLGDIKERFGRLDILVNCSGYGRKNSWESIDEEDWVSDIDVSLNGVFRVVKASYRLLAQTNGCIVNVSSMYGKVAPDYRMYDGDRFANPPSYGAAKAGILEFTRYLASFFAPYGIRVNSISPGPFPFPQTGIDNPDFIKRLGEKTPAGRIGAPHEVKGAALLLCTEAGSYINGTDIAIDGGWTAW